MAESAARLRIVPLGGLGEIGMNCLVLEQDEQLLVIDCGTSFPADDCGVDVLHPDFSWLQENRARVVGVFLTHGHEDHIGGLPYLLGALSCPLFGPAHALCLAQRRLADHGLADYDCRQVSAGTRVALGPFVIEPIRVSHSIVEATALAVSTSVGVVVHSGDFKFDETPSDNEPTDVARLRQLGDEQVRLLMSDSTNIDNYGQSGSEADVEIALDELVRAAKQRVFVALFASNVQRLISLGRIAQKRKRRICLLGRSLLTHVEVARELGYLDWPPNLLLPAERASTYPRGELMVLTSGTQAEPGAAMTRIAAGRNRFLDIERGDTVIFSSRIIPGNDRAVVDLMGDLLRRGAHVESRFSAPVHTSGHANRAEQLRMIELLQPRSFIPLHGTRHHLERHAQLAREAGVDDVMLIENGDSLVLEGENKLRRGAEVPSGQVAVGFGRHVLSKELLRARRTLGRGGLVSLSVRYDQGHALLEPISFQIVGLPGFDDETGEVELASALKQAWRSLKPARSGSLPEVLTRWLRSLIEEKYQQRPYVVVHVSQGDKLKKAVL